jgi:hypothetical protein
LNTVDKTVGVIIASLICVAVIVSGISYVESPTKTKIETTTSILSLPYTTTVTDTLITSIQTLNATISCNTTMTFTGQQGQIRGVYPNGTSWISITGVIHNAKSIQNGTLPYNAPSGLVVSIPTWIILNNC